MEKVYIKARAKINLSLSILEKRPDNYHNLESVFQKINLYDEMWIEKANTNFIEIDSNIENVKLEDNIIYKAYQKVKNRFPEIGGVKVILNKKIPMQAGLAGGSTDCASFLVSMRKLFELNMSNEDLEKLGSSLGADVVPCLYNGAIIAKGIGDRIEKINSNFKFYIIIIKPQVFSSTKDMYQKLDVRGKIGKLNANNIVSALNGKDIYKLSKNLYNDFEEVTKDVKEINNAKKVLMQNGALNTLLAGSGSAVFGIFESKEKAKMAYNNLKKNYETYICVTFN
jgi:4-diphosphocytidyl-2-C-methyl-D-erythritol kinase